jgi:hypothetical protein
MDNPEKRNWQHSANKTKKLFILVSNTYCIVFLFCFSSSCWHCVASFSSLDCPFLIAPSVFFNVYLIQCLNYWMRYFCNNNISTHWNCCLRWSTLRIDYDRSNVFTTQKTPKDRTFSTHCINLAYYKVPSLFL